MYSTFYAKSAAKTIETLSKVNKQIYYTFFCHFIFFLKVRLLNFIWFTLLRRLRWCLLWYCYNGFMMSMRRCPKMSETMFLDGSNVVLTWLNLCSEINQTIFSDGWNCFLRWMRRSSKVAKTVFRDRSDGVLRWLRRCTEMDDMLFVVRWLRRYSEWRRFFLFWDSCIMLFWYV